MSAQAVKSAAPAEARALIEAGHVYLDVRSEPEFEAGHAPGAYNVPLLHQVGGEMVENPDFAAVTQRLFPASTPLVLGCRSGVRSMRAAELLRGLGYGELVNLTGGFEGSRDAFGRPVPGWRSAGLPVETGSGGDRAYAALATR